MMVMVKLIMGDNFMEKVTNSNVNSNAKKVEKMYINSIDELDQFLHDKTIEQMKGVKKFDFKEIVIGDEVRGMDEKILFDLLLMKIVHRMLNDSELSNNFQFSVPTPSPSKRNLNAYKNIMSLLVDKDATIQ